MSENRKNILTCIGVFLNRLELTGDVHEVDEQTGLYGKGLGLDSVEVLQLVSSIEEEFDLTIDDDELLPEYFRSVGSFITFIERMLI